MPLHSAASFLDNASSSEVFYGAVGLLALYAVKAWAGGRKCTWEREWAGKMIWVVGPPSPTVLALLDYLLQLPSPPQILYLPPYPSPLPESLLTVLHTLRLGITSPLAQLHCEPLPRTHRGVRDFTQQWAKVQQGTAGEGGRRVDAIVLASGWEVQPYLTRPVDTAEDPDWSVHQFHFHLITSLLPCLIRQPAERNIRIVNLVSPTWSAALPSLHGTKPVDSLVQLSGRRSITTLYLMQHFQLILDTLASSTYGSSKPVPDPNGEVKQRDKNIQSNIMAISVIMSWARSEVIRGSMGADDSLLLWVLYILLYPVIMLFTPSPSRAIQSMLFALQVPVRYGPLDLSPVPPGEAGKDDEPVDPRRSGTRGGDVIRDCAVVDLPPVLSDPELAKSTYEVLEKEVEKGVRESATRERAFPRSPAEADKTAGEGE